MTTASMRSGCSSMDARRFESSLKLRPMWTSTRVVTVACGAQLAELPLASTQNLTIWLSPDGPYRQGGVVTLTLSCNKKTGKRQAFSRRSYKPGLKSFSLLDKCQLRQKSRWLDEAVGQGARGGVIMK